MTSGIRIYSILDNLPSYRAKGTDTNTYKFLNAFAEEMDDVETQMVNLTSEIQISTATGRYLNDIGELFNLNRLASETDDEFRSRILSHWESYSGSGTKDGIKIAMANALSITSDLVTVTEYYPLKISVQVTITTSQVELIPTLRTIITNVKAGGVAAFLDYDTLPPDIRDIFTAGVSRLGGPDVA